MLSFTPISNPSLCERQVEFDVTFIDNVFNGIIDVPDLMTILPLSVSPYYLRISPTFKTKCYLTNYSWYAKRSLNRVRRTVNGLVNVNLFYGYLPSSIRNWCFSFYILVLIVLVSYALYFDLILYSNVIICTVVVLSSKTNTNINTNHGSGMGIDLKRISADRNGWKRLNFSNSIWYYLFSLPCVGLMIRKWNGFIPNTS